MASTTRRSHQLAGGHSHRRPHPAPGAAGTGDAAVGEAVPVTIWPIRFGPTTPNRGVRTAGGPPADAVIARVLACYPARRRRLVLDGDTTAAPQPAAGAVALPPVDLLVLLLGGRACTLPNADGGPVAPDGLLVVVVPATVTVDIAAVGRQARTAGWRYLQHNVAFPAARTSPAAALSGAGPGACGHARIHADVLVFQRFGPR